MDEFAQAVQRLLENPTSATPNDLSLIRLLQLSGFVYEQLPMNHQLRGSLRGEVLQLGMRHALIKQELRSLLAVWHKAGIPVMVLKGFALAEFEYEAPTVRFYGDVDLLIPNDPATISQAVHLAIAYGWRSDGQHARPEDWTHECAHLYSPDGHVKLDVHRLLPSWNKNDGPIVTVQRITEQIWAHAVTQDWEGMPVTLPQPLDRAVIVLALGRSWGGDAGALKPADPLDLHQLYKRHGLTEAALVSRAKELGAERTWAAFQVVCSPQHPAFAMALRSNLPVLREVAHKESGKQRSAAWMGRFRRAPVLAWWMLRVLPDVYVTGRAWRQNAAQGGNPQQVLRRWNAPAHQRLSTVEQMEIANATRWWARLLYPQQAKRGVCVPRAYATFRALRRFGHPAVFVSGVARSDSGITGHAWIEDDKGVMEAYGEPLVRLRFTESFRYPPASSEKA